MNEMKIPTWHIALLSMVLWLWRLAFRDTTWWADTHPLWRQESVLFVCYCKHVIGWVNEKSN